MKGGINNDETGDFKRILKKIHEVGKPHPQRKTYNQSPDKSNAAVAQPGWSALGRKPRVRLITGRTRVQIPAAAPSLCFD